VRGSALALDASAQDLVGKGLVLAPAPLLLGKAPGAQACAAATLLCLRAALGPSGRELLAAGARAYLSALFDDARDREASGRIAQRAARAAERLLVRSDAADVRLLSPSRSPLWALRIVAATAPGSESSFEAPGPPPSCIRASQTFVWFAAPCTQSAPPDPTVSSGEAVLEAQLDLGAVDRALQELTPLDAIHGGTAGALFAARLTISGLLRRSGPVQLHGDPHPLGAEVEVRWPLH
jgi:hypothetical protein